MSHAALDDDRGDILAVCCPWHIIRVVEVSHGASAADDELLVAAVLVLVVQGVGDVGAARTRHVGVADTEVLRQGSRVVALSGGSQRGSTHVHVVGAAHQVVAPGSEHLAANGQRDVGHNDTARVGLVCDVGNGAGADIDERYVAQRSGYGDVTVAHGEHALLSDRCAGIGWRNGVNRAVAIRVAAGIAQLHGGPFSVVVATLGDKAFRGGRGGQSGIATGGYFVYPLDVVVAKVIFATHRQCSRAIVVEVGIRPTIFGAYE